jgi:hypothetical protein
MLFGSPFSSAWKRARSQVGENGPQFFYLRPLSGGTYGHFVAPLMLSPGAALGATRLSCHP